MGNEQHDDMTAKTVSSFINSLIDKNQQKEDEVNDLKKLVHLLESLAVCYKTRKLPSCNILDGIDRLKRKLGFAMPRGKE